jgi:hypothetical protein
MKNRVIKFRAFVDDKMGLPFHPFDSQFLSTGGTFPDGTIFMQFTGLLDKEGKEIYEGDYFLLDGVKLVVIFEDGKFCFDNTGGSYGRDFLETKS